MSGFDDQPNEIIHAIAFGADTLSAADVANLRAASRRAASAIRAEGLDLTKWRIRLGAEECARRGYEKEALLALDRAGLYLDPPESPPDQDPPPQRPPFAQQPDDESRAWFKALRRWKTRRAETYLEVRLAIVAFGKEMVGLLGRVAPWLYPREICDLFRISSQGFAERARMYEGARLCRPLVAKLRRSWVTARLFRVAIKAPGNADLLELLLKDYPITVRLISEFYGSRQTDHGIVREIHTRLADPALLDVFLEHGQFQNSGAARWFIMFACRVKGVGKKRLRRVFAHPKLAEGLAWTPAPGGVQTSTLVAALPTARNVAKSVIVEEMWKDAEMYGHYILAHAAGMGDVAAVESLLADPRFGRELFRLRPSVAAARYGQPETLARLLADERSRADELTLAMGLASHPPVPLEQMEAVLDLLLTDPRIL
jgi:hypothetical protein